MIRRFIAIGLIFSCVSVAWFVLGGVTSQRTHTADATLRSQVVRLWGAPQVQMPPSVTATLRVTKQVESLEEGKRIVRKVEEDLVDKVAPEGSDVQVKLDLAHRQKGLLWYATYNVTFGAAYEIVNDSAHARRFEIALPFPAKQAVFDDLQFEISGKSWTAAPASTRDRIAGTVDLEPAERIVLNVGYRSQGMDRWSYGFGEGVAEVRNFRLAMRTNFNDIDFPEDGMSPGRKERAGEGWLLNWDFKRLVSGVSITMLMPEKLQPGPLASQIVTFAPVSLLFFIVVLLTIGIVRRVDLHPMHFLFIAASFFAFHLLFAYLADQVSINAAFAIAAVTSLALTTSYLRVAFGNRFAFLAAGTAQLVYLVLFSYAFFFKGLTGLAITIGAVATLFVLMQTTARIDWNEIFARHRAATPPDPAALSVC